MPTERAKGLLEPDDCLQLCLVSLGAGAAHQVAERVEVGLGLRVVGIGLGALGLRELEDLREVEEQIGAEVRDLALGG